ncbi:uncharacterized protein LOC125231705 [Leguminivora glycinivorella]|uniref:uncharacterized protein LOC125231705 n=1 Tax=Leguminivora glycinivorella TaxID=1035111 RepID=UPI00200FDBF2|nr:uncharacterized protein LOC125231705 [Leguminivora glycinivorella]
MKPLAKSTPTANETKKKPSRQHLLWQPDKDPLIVPKIIRQYTRKKKADTVESLNNCQLASTTSTNVAATSPEQNNEQTNCTSLVNNHEEIMGRLYDIEIMDVDVKIENHVKTEEKPVSLNEVILDRTANNHAMADQPDEPMGLTDLPPPSTSNMTQDAAVSTSAMPFAEPLITAAPKSKAQRQREYRQRIAASRTPAEVITARAAETARKRNYRLRVSAGWLQSTTASSSSATGRSTLAAEPVQTTVRPSTSSDLVQVQQAQSTWNTKWKVSIKRFKSTFLDNEFGYACSVCDKLWFKNDLKPITAANLEVMSDWVVKENRQLCREKYELVCNTCKLNTPDLYLQFQKITETIVNEAARINVNGLKKLMRKALDMMDVINNYVEDDDDEITSSNSVLKMDSDKDNLQDDVKLALANFKRKSDLSNEISPKRSKIFQSTENLKTPKNNRSFTIENKNVSPNQSKFIDTFQDFVGKSLAKKDDRTVKVSKKTPPVKTKIGQYKPKSPPKKVSFSPANISPKNVKDIEYEVKEQENDCNILILKI